MPAHRRALVLVDGEHHEDAIRAALAELQQAGDEPVLVLYLGGSEKVEHAGKAPVLGWPAQWPRSPAQELPRLLAASGVDVVIDRTADPVVDDRRRHALVALALAAGVPYESPGARWDPLDRQLRVQHPSVAVIATGKRTGKTAIAGALARHAVGRGRRPVIVAMGRGGPPDPIVIPAGRDLTMAHLAEVAARGEHAASDFYEDAVMTGVATVGCRRVGEGPAGQVGMHNLDAGLAAVRQLDVDLAILEGSGAAVPPCHADATMLVVPATVEPAALHAMLPLRFALADLIVVSLADPRLIAAEQVDRLLETIVSITDRLPRVDGRRAPLGLVTTRFRTTPLQDIAGARVMVATTAPVAAAPAIGEDLAASGAEVVGITHALSDRARLRPELSAAPDYDVLVTELKAAAVDVAVASAHQRGAEAVFYDNRPETVAGSALAGVASPAGFEAALDDLIGLAIEQHAIGGGAQEGGGTWTGSTSS